MKIKHTEELLDRVYHEILLFLQPLLDDELQRLVMTVRSQVYRGPKYRDVGGCAGAEDK